MNNSTVVLVVDEKGNPKEYIMASIVLECCLAHWHGLFLAFNKQCSKFGYVIAVCGDVLRPFFSILDLNSYNIQVGKVCAVRKAKVLPEYKTHLDPGLP